MRGAPRRLRNDNDPEFVSRPTLALLTDPMIETALIEPGNPWRNSANEPFNGEFATSASGCSGSRTEPRRACSLAASDA